MDDQKLKAQAVFHGTSGKVVAAPPLRAEFEVG